MRAVARNYGRARAPLHALMARECGVADAAEKIKNKKIFFATTLQKIFFYFF